MRPFQIQQQNFKTKEIKITRGDKDNKFLISNVYHVQAN
jgi:hypothetical protein